MKPKDLEYEIVSYTDDSKDLTCSDWDRLKKEIDLDSNEPVQEDTQAISGK